MSDNDYTPENELTCGYWSASSAEAEYVRIVGSAKGGQNTNYPVVRDISIRPALSLSETSKLKPTARKKGVNGIDVVEYGKYPQMVADESMSAQLDKLFQSKSLCLTGKNYTFDATDAFEEEKKFKAKSYAEYEYKGKKYIRVKGHQHFINSRLSNGKEVEDNKIYWIQVEPIEWLADPSGTWVAKKTVDGYSV